MSTQLERTTSKIWLRGGVTGKEAEAKAKAHLAELTAARKTLRDYIAHTAPHVVPSMGKAASKAVTVLARKR